VRHLALTFSLSGALFVGCSAGALAPTERGPNAEPDTPPTTDRPGPLPTKTDASEPIAYVALGDSYTIGTSVPVEDRWPNQLVRALQPEFELRLVENLGVNGYTSSDLMVEELPQLASLDADLVSVLIGVNDVVQDVATADYRQNVGTILDELAGDPDRRIVVVSTPDYTLTPKGEDYGESERQSQRIHRFNEILAEETEARGLAYVDISPVSELVLDDATLVADDGLHPSGKQYAAWVELIAPVVRRLLDERSGR
jgi:acyl-CoA thioesterase-1